MSFYIPYPRKKSVAQLRTQSEKQLRTLQKTAGGTLQPVRIDGRSIAQSFWGQGWCTHMERFSDLENRLPRGRSYVRHGAICDLKIESGRVLAQVSGSELYHVEIKVAALPPVRWESLKQRCSGQVGSLLELLRGQLSAEVMTRVTHRTEGLFPQPGDMQFCCSCPDWASMCKHVAAVLYGVGNRLDRQPELLFLLRGRDAAELIDSSLGTLAPPSGDRSSPGDTIADDQLAAIFGIELDMTAEPATAVQTAMPTNPVKSARSAKSAKTPKATAPEPASGGQAKAGKRATASPAKVPGMTLGNKPIASTAIAKKAQKTAEKYAAEPDAASRTLSKLAIKRASRAEPLSTSTASTRNRPLPAPASKAFRPTARTIARLRKQLGLTIAQFAAALAVSPASVYRWEAAGAGALTLQAHCLAALEKLHRKATRLQQATIR